jgi:hypothetical protein
VLAPGATISFDHELDLARASSGTRRFNFSKIAPQDVLGEAAAQWPFGVVVIG